MTCEKYTQLIRTTLMFGGADVADVDGSKFQSASNELSVACSCNKYTATLCLLVN